MASPSGSLYKELGQWLGCSWINMQTSVPGQVDFIHWYLQQILCRFRVESGPPEKLARLCQYYTRQSGHPRKTPELVFGVHPVCWCWRPWHKLISEKWNHASGISSSQSLGTEAWAWIGVPWLPQRGPIVTRFSKPHQTYIGTWWNYLFVFCQRKTEQKAQ